MLPGSPGSALEGNFDGPRKLIRVPVVPQDWTDLGLRAPDYVWPCQEASGNLASTASTLALVAANGPTYQTTVTDWSRKSVNMAEASGVRFTAAAASGPNPASTSVAWLIYFKLTAGVSGANRRLLVGAAGLTTTGVGVNITTANVARIYCVNVAANGVYDYNDGAVHPLLLVYNRTASTVAYFTDKETLAGTYNAGVVDAAKGLGEAAQNSAPAGVLYMTAAAGAVAESYGKSTLSALGWALAY